MNYFDIPGKTCPNKTFLSWKQVVKTILKNK